MSMLSLRRRRAAQKGFNLIEAAIVLGIVGLVVGGIWVAATSVYANLRSKSATDQLLAIAQSVRALYATSNTTGLAAAADMTVTVAQANGMPSSVLTTAPSGVTAGGANTQNPWGGDIAITNFNAAGSQFIITFSSVPSAACLDFVMRNAGSGHDTGMLGVSGQALTAPLTAITAPTAITYALTPGVGISAANATTACGAGAAAARDIAFFFSLKG